VKGIVTARQVEEFTRIYPKKWRWTARRLANNMFHVRFPNAQMISEWECFNPINMRNVKAKVKVSPWSGAVGAKAELEQAWFQVKGIPNDKGSIPTLAYVGSLVGATVETDDNSLHRIDYVRIKIAAKVVAKVPEVAEGAIIPYMISTLRGRLNGKIQERKGLSRLGLTEGLMHNHLQKSVEMIILPQKQQPCR
jgi:hypothetical protein